MKDPLCCLVGMVSSPCRCRKSVSPLKKVKCEAVHSAARPGVSEKIAFFPRNDRPYDLKRSAFQTENAYERKNEKKKKIVDKGSFFG